MRVWTAPWMAGLWAHETRKGVARFSGKWTGRGGRGRESPMLWGMGRRILWGWRWGQDRRDATWKVCLDTAGRHPQAEALNFPLIYTFY